MPTTTAEPNLSPSVELMVVAFMSAKVAAQAACVGEDGGTCNLDYACLHLSKRLQKRVEKAAGIAGCRVRFSVRNYGKSGFCVGFDGIKSGQGARNERVVAATVDALRSANLPAFHVYITD